MVNTPVDRATDPRPARTRAAIMGAVPRLIADPAASGEISVNAIARAAGVSRSAFYAQFADLDELAVALLVDAFRDIGLDDVDARHDPRADALVLARESSRRLVAHIDERRAFYSASLDWRLSGRVHESVVSAYAQQVLATMRVLDDGVPPDVVHDDAARFVAGGAIAMLTAWLRDEEPDGRDAMADRLVAVMPDWLVGTA
jgi:AcrR family transcriptional regulator